MTTATLRPNGTLVAFDSLGGGAGSSHAATNDDSDTTYGVTNNLAVGAIPVQLNNGTTTLPSGSVTKQVRVRARVRGDSTTTSARAFIQTTEGGPAVAAVDGRTVNAATIQDITGSYVPVTWTQSNVDQVLLAAGVYGEGDSSVRFYELYIDLMYVTQPSVAVDAVSPDPYTASTIVPISWVNTLDADGGGQTRYEVKVFTDAQYGAGGFDPDTSEPYYTSGIVVTNPGIFGLGAETEADVGPLEDGDTYRAYVRVAQTVNGALHWSDWDYDEFTMDVTTSDVDSVTLAPTDDAGASIVVTVNWDAGTQPWNFVEVQRSIDYGTTWVDVRGATYAPALAGNTEFVVTDYEVGNGVTAKYRARATYLSSGLPITGSWVESTLSATWVSDYTWIKDPLDPSKNMVVKLREVPEESYGVRQGVFHVLGSPNAVVVSDVRQGPSVEISVKVDTIEDVARLRDLLSSQVVLIHAPDSYDLGFDYVALGPANRQRHRRFVLRAEWWPLSAIQVDAPADPDAGR